MAYMDSLKGRTFSPSLLVMNSLDVGNFRTIYMCWRALKVGLFDVMWS